MKRACPRGSLSVCLVGLVMGVVIVTNLPVGQQSCMAAEENRPAIEHAGKADAAGSDGVVRFRGRSIDIFRHLQSFPYDPWRWQGSIKHKSLVFLHHRDGKQLVANLDLYQLANKPAALDQAGSLCERDWSTSLTFDWKICKQDGAVFLTADENNNERFNLYRLDPATKKATKLTDVAYIPGYSFSPDDSKVAYIERMGKEGSRCRLHVLDLASKEDRVVASDSEEQQFTWSNISWQPKGKSLVLTTLFRGDRNKGNLACVALPGEAKAAPRVLTDTSVSRTFPEGLKHWYNDDEVLITSSEEGVRNVYRLNVQTGQQARLTNLPSDVDFVEITTIGGTRFLVVSVPGPLSTTIYRYNLATKSPEAEKILEQPQAIQILDLDGDRMLLKNTSATEPILVEEFRIASVPTATRPLAGLSDDIIEKSNTLAV